MNNCSTVKVFFEELPAAEQKLFSAKEKVMKKTYRIEVDCPNCAAKLENCVKGIDGVESCSVNLMTQKLVVNAAAEKQKEIISNAIDQMKKIDDDVVIFA